MIVHLGSRAAIAVVLGWSGIATALAQDEVRYSVYSSISRADCPAVKGKKPTGDAHEAIVHRCPTPFGFEVTKTYLGAAVQITIAKPKVSEQAKLGAGYDAGETIEWRGIKKGPDFTPHAAVVRLISRNEAGRQVSVLAILRVEKDRVCPAAWLDAGANPQANDLARKSADNLAGTFRCGTSEPTVIGPTTELVKDIAARSPGRP